jgi:penicillin amidase
VNLRRSRAGWLGLGLMAVGLMALLVAALERGRTRSAARAAFPAIEGVVRVVGCEAPVEILRGPRGFAHVEAQSEADAWFGLGFLHAQDRMAQMYWLVRLARGRSAEVLGREGLPSDRLARTLDLGGVADAEWKDLRGPTRRMLEAYARGVNARVARVRAGEVAPPVALSAAELPPEDWRPADSLAVLKFYAWALSGSLDASLVLHDLLGHLGGVEARPFFPASQGDDGIPASDRLPLTARVWVDPLRRAAGLRGGSAGSSAWVVGGAHSASGRPLLAADVHLEPTAPPLLHVAHLRGGGLDVSGATLPGVPAVWTGHNRGVAWASTHARAAVTDLYLERLGPDGEARYHDGRRWRPLLRREERIEVRGGAPEILEIHSTHHGPLMDGRLGAGRDPLAIAWVGLEGRGGATLRALQDAARAPDAAALLEALSRLSEPALALVYADANGAAGMQVVGWVPQRPLATGLVPVPGRARWYDWDGPVPVEHLPRQRLRDGRGWAIAADNRLTTGSGERIEWLWRSGTRARRIDAALRATLADGPVSVEGLTALQADLEADRDRALAQAALGLVEDRSLGREASEVAELLRDWDGAATPMSVGAASYYAFLTALTRSLFQAELGDALFDRYLALPQADPGEVVRRIVEEAAAGGEPGAWSDREQVAAAVHTALREAWFQLSSRLGGSRRKWRWGRLHQLRFRAFGSPTKGAAAALGPYEAGGSGSTVATAEFAPDEPFDVRMAAIYRFAVDTAQLDRSLGSLAPGQSEHPGHPHFDDGVSGWLGGRPVQLAADRALVEQMGATRLTLEPAP